MTLNRRQWLSAMVSPILGTNVPMQTGFALTGQLTDDASDLQLGYFNICGTDTGICKNTDALGISVHPLNPHYLGPLQSMVGRNVELTIRPA